MTDSTIQHIATVFPITAEALKPDLKYHRRVSIFRDFGLNTSTHGVPGIARSRSIPNRIFWTISSLICTGVMLYFIIVSIQAYFGYPTQASVDIVVGFLQPFPAVSICNYSPVRFDTFIDPFLNFTNSLNLTNTTNNSTISYIQAGYIRDFFQYIFNNELPASQYLFPLDSMLIKCIYNGQSCNSSDFIQFLSASYGACYTFNAQIKSNPNSVRYTTDNGDIGRLQLRLYAHSQQYVPFLAQDVSVGMVAMIHDNTELPLIDVAGIELAPGRRHKLSYKKSTHQLLSSPYSDCTEEIPLVMQAMFDRYAGADYAYSAVLCYTLCTQLYVYLQCNCVSPYQWTTQSIVLPGTDRIIIAPLCDLTDSCYLNATIQITNTESIWNQYCSDCSEECSTVDFTVTPSAVSAPSIMYTYSFKDFVENSGIALSTDWSTTWETEIPNNYIAVDVVCETTRVETYTESASISGADVVSNVGGQTGLWIGISFLSIMEFVEMFYRLLRYHYYIARKKMKKKKRKKTQNVISEQL